MTDTENEFSKTLRNIGKRFREIGSGDISHALVREQRGDQVSVHIEETRCEPLKNKTNKLSQPGF